MKKFVLLLFVILGVIIPSHSPAPIYGLFPGLEFLDKKSDHIVVARVLEALPGKSGMGFHEDYKIGIYKSIKGALKDDTECTVSLRFLTRIGDPHAQKDGAFHYHRFDPWPDRQQFYIIFAKDGKAWTGTEAGRQIQPDGDCYSLNYEGSVIPISGSTNLSLADGKSPIEAVKALILDSLEAEQQLLQSRKDYLTHLVNSEDPKAW